MAADAAQAEDAPPAYALQAELIAIEALLSSGRQEAAEERLTLVGSRLQPSGMSSIWGEFLRLRGRVHARGGRSTEAYHDFGQSVSVCDLLGERYQAALSYLELGRLAGAAGARSRATRYLGDALAISSRWARSQIWPKRALRCHVPAVATGGFVGVQMDGDDALVRRIVDAAVMPALLARKERRRCSRRVTRRQLSFSSHAGRPDSAGRRPRAATPRRRARLGRLRRSHRRQALRSSSSRSGATRTRRASRSCPRPAGRRRAQRFRTLCAVLRQGFELSWRASGRRNRGRRDRAALEPLLPGSSARAPRCSASPTDPAAAGQRPDGADHRESGTGKDSWRGRSTPDRRAREACSCPTTARARRASSPTASCSVIAAAASPARWPINRAC